MACERRRRGGRAVCCAATLESDIQSLDDSFRSPAEWILEVSVLDAARFQLQHYQTGRYLTLEGLTELRPGEVAADWMRQPIDRRTVGRSR